MNTNRTTSESITYILIVLVFSFLFSFGVIKWDGKIGIADLINIGLAIITLTAVRYSKMAAESAEISTKLAKEAITHTEEQTKILGAEFDNTHKPKLIPNKHVVRIPFLKFPTNKDSGFDSHIDAMVFSVTNVFEGKAYNVKAWLEIPKDIVEKYNKRKSPSYYEDKFEKEEYHLSFTYNELSKLNSVLLQIYSKDKLYRKDGLISGSYGTLDFINQNVNHPILYSGKEINVEIPNHVRAIILTEVYEKLSDSTKENMKNLQLFITYKTSVEIDTDSYYLRKYNVTLDNIYPSDKDYMNFTFSFKLLSEEFKK